MAKGNKLAGRIVADEIDVRYAFSGKIAVVKKRTGDVVKRGEVLAALDSKLLQMELDVQLADYERTRAEFEIFGKRNTGQDDQTNFLRKIEQAQLNASVKEVELAKAKMDQVVLISPVSGIILDDGGNRVGLNASPASNDYKILDTDSKRFRIELDEAIDLKDITVKIGEKEYTGEIGVIRPDGNGFVVDVNLGDYSDLIVGMKGEVK
ncbi:MAG: biotin/lipoyl-binding protein [Patescibacteria group bacterium]